MASFTQVKNTDKYHCTSCGSDAVSIIREDPQGHNPKLKCGSCGFFFNGKDALAAEAAGAIKASSEESLAAASEPETEHIAVSTEKPSLHLTPNKSSGGYFSQVLPDPLPQRPAYLFVSKDRKVSEVCSKADLHKTAIKWSSEKHDCYELTKLNLSVKVEVGSS